MLPVNVNKDAAAMKESFHKESQDKKSLKETIDEFLKQYPKESVKETSKQESLKEPINKSFKESVKESLEESLSELPKKSPKKSPKKGLKESHKESPKEFLKESPKETHKGSIKESLEESPKRSPKETFKQEFLKESNKKSLKKSAKESAKQTLKETPKETLKETIKETPEESPKESHKKSPKDTFNQDILKESIIKTPKKTLKESNETLIESPIETSLETPIETHKETPKDNIKESRKETPKESPKETPEETPKESLIKESFYEETSTDILNENIRNETSYLDAIEATSDTLPSLLTDTTVFEEFGSQLEFFQRSKEIADTFNWTILFQPNRLPPRLERLIYWREFTKSGLTFVGGLSLLLALNRFSVIFVVPFLLLHLMLGSVTLRMFKTVMRTANIPYIAHDLLDYDNLVLILSREKVQNVTGSLAEGFNDLLGHLINLFLFKNACDSMHLSIFLVSLAMLGRMMNGMTMAISVYIFMFTIPKLYELNKSFVDHKLECMRKYLTTVVHKFREALEH